MQQQDQHVPHCDTALQWEWACCNYLHLGKGAAWLHRHPEVQLRVSVVCLSVWTIVYRKQQWERKKKEEVREPGTCWLWRRVKNRKIKNETEGMEEALHWNLCREFSETVFWKIVGIRNLTHREDVYMGSYFNYIRGNYLNEKVADLYTCLFIPKLTEIYILNMYSPFSILSQWGCFSLFVLLCGLSICPRPQARDHGEELLALRQKGRWEALYCSYRDPHTPTENPALWLRNPCLQFSLLCAGLECSMFPFKHLRTFFWQVSP